MGNHVLRFLRSHNNILGFFAEKMQKSGKYCCFRTLYKLHKIWIKSLAILRIAKRI